MVVQGCGQCSGLDNSEQCKDLKTLAPSPYTGFGLQLA